MFPNEGADLAHHVMAKALQAVCPVGVADFGVLGGVK